MNNRQREERRLQRERREATHGVKPIEPEDIEDLPRSHRMCEREVIDLKTRMSALELALAEAGDVIVSGGNPEYKATLIKHIDALLTPTEKAT